VSEPTLDAAAMHRALQVVIDLHAPVVRAGDTGESCCPRCYDDPSWPCKTIQAITHELRAAEQPEGSDRG
jgi:hypothetical protein